MEEQNEYKCPDCQVTWQIKGTKADGTPVDNVDDVSWCPNCESPLDLVEKPTE